VSAFAAGQEPIPRPVAEANVKPLCGAFRNRKDRPDLSPALSKRSKYPMSKTEQEKGGWSYATTRRERSPAVLGFFGLPPQVDGLGGWCRLGGRHTVKVRWIEAY